MPPEDRDAAYLWDMLDAAKSIRTFTAGGSYEDYAKDRMKQMAVERAVEIIGEAARRVSEDFKREHPQIPWQQIIGQRNVLAHEYDKVRQDRIWRVASKHVPELIAKLEPLVPRLGPETG